MAFLSFVSGGFGFGFGGGVSFAPKSKIAERLSDIAKRCGDLSPLKEPIRQVLWEGNKIRSLRGVDVQGNKFAPLAISTLRNRKGFGPPLAPHWSDSRVVTQYVVNVQAGVGRLSFTGAWPGLYWMEYHQTGTRHMPARPPYGFRKIDIDAIRPMLNSYVMKGRWS